MNANEIADEAEMWGKDLLALNMKGGIPVIECARMLRQLQAENEALKTKLTGAESLIKMWTPIIIRHSPEEHLK